MPTPAPNNHNPNHQNHTGLLPPHLHNFKPINLRLAPGDVEAAADVNPLITGTGMKSTRKPVDMTCTRSSSVVLDIVEW